MADKESGAKKPALARTVKDKWRSKHWYRVRAPGLFQHVELGETVATEPEQVVGRTLEATLPELSGSGDSGKAHVKLRFRIERVSGEGVAEARFIGHDLTSDYVRRLARTEALEDRPRADRHDQGRRPDHPEAGCRGRAAPSDPPARRAPPQDGPDPSRGGPASDLAGVRPRDDPRGPFEGPRPRVEDPLPAQEDQIRRSEVLGQIAEEIPGPEPTALTEPSTPPEEASVADASEGPAASAR